MRYSPDDQSQWGSFQMLRNDNNKKLKIILDSAAQGMDMSLKIDGDLVKTLGAFWHLCMDTASVEGAGHSALAGPFDRIDAASSKADLLLLRGKLACDGVPGAAFFSGPFPIADFKNSDWTCPAISQGGLGMPNKEFYLDEAKAEIAGKYQVLVCEMFELLGYTHILALNAAEKVFNIEKHSRVPSTKGRNAQRLIDLG